jgi:restriction system protein
VKKYKVITPLFPTYDQTRAMMNAVAGCSVKAVRNMITAIQEQTGTPQNPVDWSEPDNWIKERLSGEDAKIAWQIWKMDNHILNPRHSYGCYMFINNPLFDLMQTHEDGGWYPSEQGRLFLDNDEATLVRFRWASPPLPKWCR